MCVHCVFVAQVTVLIYSDLLLFTREDEAGRCNVLQSPLYLNTLQLTEGTHAHSIVRNNSRFPAGGSVQVKVQDMSRSPQSPD